MKAAAAFGPELDRIRREANRDWITTTTDCPRPKLPVDVARGLLRLTVRRCLQHLHGAASPGPPGRLRCMGRGHQALLRKHERGRRGHRRRDDHRLPVWGRAGIARPPSGRRGALRRCRSLSFKRASLDGPLALGARAKIVFGTGLRLHFRVVEFEAGRLFTDESRLPGACMGHRHLVEPTEDGGSRLTNTIYIDGPPSPLWRRILGPAAARTLPEAQRTVVELAAKSA